MEKTPIDQIREKNTKEINKYNFKKFKYVKLVILVHVDF